MCLLLSHWGIDKCFVLPERRLEQIPDPLKSLQKRRLTSVESSVESGYHPLDMVVREQSMAKALTTPLITRLS